jgi:hypothetical protein
MKRMMIPIGFAFAIALSICMPAIGGKGQEDFGIEDPMPILKTDGPAIGVFNQTALSPVFLYAGADMAVMTENAVHP